MIYVDIPNPEAIGEDDESWTNVLTCETRKEAIQFIQEYFGGDESGRICLISGTEDNPDQEASPVKEVTPEIKLTWKDVGYGFYKANVKGYQLTVGWDSKKWVVIINTRELEKTFYTVEAAQLAAESIVLTLARQVVSILSEKGEQT